ncbi:MAG: hypothetical protein ABW136_01390 [Steroidobacteraceae bacterium]
MPTIRRRLTRLARALCALVAVAMTLAPVLSTAADSHEAAHTAQGEHHFHAADAAHTHGAGDEMSDAGDLLHGLTHAVHACAHAFAILASDAPSFAAADAATSIVPAVTAPPDAPRTHPFRPPIA